MTARHGECGFTMLEILLAIMILTLGLVSVYALYPVGLALMRDTIELNTATAIAQNAAAIMNTNQVGRLIVQSYIDEAMTPGTGPWFFAGPPNGDPRFANLPLKFDSEYGNVVNNAPFYSSFYSTEKGPGTDSVIPIDESYTWSAVITNLQFIRFVDGDGDDKPDEIIAYRDVDELLTETQMDQIHNDPVNPYDMQCKWLASDTRDEQLPFKPVPARRFDFVMMPRDDPNFDPADCFLSLLHYDSGVAPDHRWLHDSDFPMVPNPGGMYDPPLVAPPVENSITPTVASFSNLQGTSGLVSGIFVQDMAGNNQNTITLSGVLAADEFNIGDWVYVFTPTREDETPAAQHDSQEFLVTDNSAGSNLTLANAPTAGEPLQTYSDPLPIFLSRIVCEWTAGSVFVGRTLTDGTPSLAWPTALTGFSRVPFHIVAPTGEIYRVIAIEDNTDPLDGLPPGNLNWLRLDRPYTGPTSGDPRPACRVGRFYPPVFSAQVAVYRNYEVTAGKAGDATFIRGSKDVILATAAGDEIPGEGSYIRRIIQQAAGPPNPKARKVSRWYQVQSTEPVAAGTKVTLGSAYLDEGPPKGDGAGQLDVDDDILDTSDYEITTKIVRTYEVTVSGF